MQCSLTQFSSLLFALSITLTHSAEALAPKVTWCSSETQTKCICMEWDLDGGTHIEVRCPSGGSTDGWYPKSEGPWEGTPEDVANISNPDGTWDVGRNFDPPPNRGQSLEANPELEALVDRAKSAARSKVEDPDSLCAKLFAGNPLMRTATGVLDAVNWRDGAFMYRAGGGLFCNGERYAFVIPNDGKREAYICPEFANLSPGARAAVLIHEAWHLAGQREEKNGTGSGPGSQPASWRISWIVGEACNLPNAFL